MGGRPGAQLLLVVVLFYIDTHSILQRPAFLIHVSLHVSDSLFYHARNFFITYFIRTAIAKRSIALFVDVEVIIVILAFQ